MCVLLMLTQGCANKPDPLPSRLIPQSLGVKRVAYDDKPDEFIFCSKNMNGLWGCPNVTKKTPIEGDDSFNELRKTVMELSEINNKKILAANGQPVIDGEQPIPDFKPQKVIYFEFDNSSLDPAAKVSILDAVPLIKKAKKIELHGYTDSKGYKGYNQKLGYSRANSVKSFLIKLGVPSQTIKAYGHGLCCYAMPDASDDSEHALNRRVEFYIHVDQTKS